MKIKKKGIKKKLKKKNKKNNKISNIIPDIQNNNNMVQSDLKSLDNNKDTNLNLEIKHINFSKTEKPNEIKIKNISKNKFDTNNLSKSKSKIVINNVSNLNPYIYKKKSLNSDRKLETISSNIMFGKKEKHNSKTKILNEMNDKILPKINLNPKDSYGTKPLTARLNSIKPISKNTTIIDRNKSSIKDSEKNNRIIVNNNNYFLNYNFYGQENQLVQTQSQISNIPDNILSNKWQLLSENSINVDNLKSVRSNIIKNQNIQNSNIYVPKLVNTLKDISCEKKQPKKDKIILPSLNIKQSSNKIIKNESLKSPKELDNKVLYNKIEKSVNDNGKNDINEIKDVMKEVEEIKDIKDDFKEIKSVVIQEEGVCVDKDNLLNVKKNKLKLKIKSKPAFSSVKTETNNVASNLKLHIFEKNFNYYIISSFNNCEAVKKVMKTRPNWKECFSEANSLFHFKWKETSSGIDFKNLNKLSSLKQSVNHFEFHYEISNKMNLFINMISFCEKYGLNIFEYTPFTIIASIGSNSFESTMDNFSKLFKNVSKYSVYKDENMDGKENKSGNKSIDPNLTKKLTSQKFYKNSEKQIDKNDLQDKNINVKYSTFFNLSDFCIFDKTGSKSIISIKSKCNENLWLIKAVNMNRGMCIKIVNTIDGVNYWVRKFNKGVCKNFKESELEEITEKEKYKERLEKSCLPVLKSMEIKTGNIIKKEPFNLENEGGINKDLDKNKIVQNIKSFILDDTQVESKKNILSLSCNKSSNILNSIKSENLQQNQKDKTNENQINVSSKDNKKETISLNNNNNNSKKSKYRNNVVIIQKYLENPCLYYGRKFDIRMWVLVTHNLEVYVFREGHLKASSVLFDIKSMNSFIHLTNYSVQKYNEEFSKHEIGNEISFNSFQEYLDKYEINISMKNDIYPKLLNLIEISMRSISHLINLNNRENCFELFGYDFILDDQFNAYILEVNTNPGLEDSSPLISMLIPRMLDDMFKLTIDEIFKSQQINSINSQTNNPNNNENINQSSCQNNKRQISKIKTKSTSKSKAINVVEITPNTISDTKIKYENPSLFEVLGYSNYENMFEKVCDLTEKFEKCDPNLINKKSIRISSRKFPKIRRKNKSKDNKKISSETNIKVIKEIEELKNDPIPISIQDKQIINDNECLLNIEKNECSTELKKETLENNS